MSPSHRRNNPQKSECGLFHLLVCKLPYLFPSIRVVRTFRLNPKATEFTPKAIDSLTAGRVGPAVDACIGYYSTLYFTMFSCSISRALWEVQAQLLLRGSHLPQ